MMWPIKSKENAIGKVSDLAKADRAERFEIYKLTVEMADRVSQRRQLANTFYLSINTFLITASAYIGVSDISGSKTLLVCLSGIAISTLWTKAIESYKTLNVAKYHIINEIEKNLIEKPYSDEWALINPAIHGKSHRPFHQTERSVPIIFIILFVLQALLTLSGTEAFKTLANCVFGSSN